MDVRGIGLPGPGALARNGEIEIDVGNAGTLLRLLPGWLAGQGGGAWTLDGDDDSIRRRPVDHVAEPLSMMGASVSAATGGFPRCASRARSWLGSSTGCRSRARR